MEQEKAADRRRTGIAMSSASHCHTGIPRIGADEKFWKAIFDLTGLDLIVEFGILSACQRDQQIFRLRVRHTNQLQVSFDIATET